MTVTVGRFASNFKFSRPVDLNTVYFSCATCRSYGLKCFTPSFNCVILLKCIDSIPTYCCPASIIRLVLTYHNCIPPVFRGCCELTIGDKGVKQRVKLHQSDLKALEDWEEPLLRKNCPVVEARLLEKYKGIVMYDPDEKITYIVHEGIFFMRGGRVGGA